MIKKNNILFIGLFFLLYSVNIFAGDTVLWQENFDYTSTTGLTNIWGPGIYRITASPFNGIAAARNKFSFGISKYFNEKRNGVNAPGFNPVLDWRGVNEIQMWVQITNYPASISTNARLMIRLYNNATSSKITNVHFTLTNIELKKWRLVSFPTNKISQYLAAVTNIAIYYRRNNSDSDSGKIGMYYDDLQVGKIAPIFVDSFSANSADNSTSTVSNLDNVAYYSNNMTVHLRIDVGEIRFPNTITGDFSEIDSGFSSANITIFTQKYRDYINGVYDISYKISSGNSIWGKNKTVKIIATDRFGNGPTTNSTFKLNIFTGKPQRISLLSPASSIEIPTLTPQFIWTSGTNAESYQLQVSSDIGFSGIVLTTNVNTTNYTVGVGILSSETKYYWRVKGKNYFGDGVWSSTNNFTTPEKVSVSTNIVVNYFSNVIYTDGQGSVFNFSQGSYGSGENIVITIETFELNDSDFIMGYYLKPENIIFDKDITIKFLISSSKIPAGKSIKDVVIKYYSNGEWIQLNSRVENSYVVIEVKNTGKFAAFIGTPITEKLKIIKLSSKVFSPNGDGDNDLLRFNIESSSNPTDIKIYIYDIYGNLIKELRGDNPVWTGDSETGILPKGLYLYKVEDGAERKTGSFVIVK